MMNSLHANHNIMPGIVSFGDCWTCGQSSIPACCPRQRLSSAVAGRINTFNPCGRQWVGIQSPLTWFMIIAGCQFYTIACGTCESWEVLDNGIHQLPSRCCFKKLVLLTRKMDAGDVVFCSQQFLYNNWHNISASLADGHNL